ncbi:hypothetical protein [Streptomyces sp. NPDC001222]|uniref:hypothetical protein n=1 Tax=Streptomyces sp. NPDC001222 TaxID=3364548 RepID=UPI0036A25CD2
MQIGFAPLETLLPNQLRTGRLDVRWHTGHFGGATADAVLPMVRRGEEPQLALSCATSGVSDADARALAETVRIGLRRLVTLDEHAPPDRMTLPRSPGSSEPLA